MSKVTMKAFIENSQIDASLIRAVVRQMGGWESFKESAKDVSEHGAGCGFGGFIYYNETIPFTKRHKKNILAYSKQLANEIGAVSEYDMIAGFKCLQLDTSEVVDAIYNPRSEVRVLVFNALAWFALEEVARSYVDFTESM